MRINPSDHWVLVQAGLADGRDLLAGARAFCAAQGWTLHRAAWSREQGRAYVYLRAPDRDVAAARHGEAFEQHCAGTHDVRLSLLEPVFDVAGASAGERPRCHYVVEMDPEAGWMPEISRWYDGEHMPGLAAVPGCIRAMRFLNRGHGPLSLACYDLLTADALGSAPWLAVRGSAWSDVTRPHFTNTQRTLFEVPEDDT